MSAHTLDPLNKLFPINDKFKWTDLLKKNFMATKKIVRKYVLL